MFYDGKIVKEMETMTQKKACPKDADTPRIFRDVGVTCCGIKSDDGYYCTRNINHTGEHHAHGINKKCCKVWK